MHKQNLRSSKSQNLYWIFPALKINLILDNLIDDYYAEYFSVTKPIFSWLYIHKPRSDTSTLRNSISGHYLMANGKHNQTLFFGEVKYYSFRHYLRPYAIYVHQNSTKLRCYKTWTWNSGRCWMFALSTFAWWWIWANIATSFG